MTDDEYTPPPFETLRLQVGAQVGRLTLTRPERRNPLGTDALREIIAACAWLDARDCHAVIVTGEGPAFSGGFDRKQMDDPDLDVRTAMELGAAMADAVERVAAVTIAAVQGHCVGGGVVLAAACDLRLAGADARFSIPEVDLGMPLGWGGIPRLVREIGPARTRELVLTCRPFDAAEAARIGFVNEVVDDGHLHARADELAATLSAKPWPAVRATLTQVRRSSIAMVPDDPGTTEAIVALSRSPER